MICIVPRVCLAVGLLMLPVIASAEAIPTATPTPRPAATKATRISISSASGVDTPARAPSPSSTTVIGRVFEDTDSDGVYTQGKDLPLPGVGVTDGVEIVLTDTSGAYQIKVDTAAGWIAVSKPVGFSGRADFFRRLLPGGKLGPAPAAAHAEPDAIALPAGRGAPADGTAPPTPATKSATGFETQELSLDFPLRRSGKAAAAALKIVHVGDIGCGGKGDRARLASAITDIVRANSEATIVVATGETALLRGGADAANGYAGEIEKSSLPWVSVYGVPPSAPNLPGANVVEAAVESLRTNVSPDYWSLDVGGAHLIFLGGQSQGDAAARRRHWLETDVQLLGQGRPLIVAMSEPPTEAEMDDFASKKVKVVLHGGRWATRMVAPRKSGMAVIGQSPLLVGGVDTSPAGYRVVTVSGDHSSTEFHVFGQSRVARIIYPLGELTGEARVLANITSPSEITEVRYRVESTQGLVGEGVMKQVGPVSWMGSLDATALGAKSLPPQFIVRVRATDKSGRQWDAMTQASPAAGRFGRSQAAAAVKTEADWPQFMGNAQRTGDAAGELRPPLSLRWATPSHGSVDVSSPVFYKGNIALGIKDRDNLMNNGVVMVNPATGTIDHFRQADSAINHSAAYSDDPQDGPGSIHAVSVGGTVYRFKGDSGVPLGEGSLAAAPTRWVFGSPAVQGRLAVMGSAGGMMAMAAQFGERRWMSMFGSDAMPSFASPALAGELLVSGGQRLTAGGNSAGVFALEANSGNVRWTNDCPGISGSVSVGGGRGFAIDAMGKLKSIDLKTGSDIAAAQLAKGWSVSTPASDGDIVVAPSGGGTVEAFDAKTLSRRWTFRSGRGLWKMAPFDAESRAIFSSPTISGNVIYIGCSDGHLYALDKATGQAVWNFDFGVPTLSTPCVSGNALFTSAYDGNVYAFTGIYTPPPPKPKESKGPLDMIKGIAK